MSGSVLKMGNLVMCSPAMFANNAQMVDKDSELLPRELVYMTHGNALDISGMDEIGREHMRKMLGREVDRIMSFAILRYSDKDRHWVRSEFSHFDGVIDCLARAFGQSAGSRASHADE